MWNQLEPIAQLTSPDLLTLLITVAVLISLSGSVFTLLQAVTVWRFFNLIAGYQLVYRAQTASSTDQVSDTTLSPKDDSPTTSEKEHGIQSPTTTTD